MFHAAYRSIRSLTVLGLIVAVLCGCNKLEAPETGARADAAVLAADYPELLTADQIARDNAAAGGTADSLSEQQALAARLARLRAAAAALDRSVLTDAERARMNR